MRKERMLIAMLVVVLLGVTANMAEAQERGIQAEGLKGPLKLTASYFAWPDFRPGMASVRPLGYERLSHISRAVVTRQLDDIRENVGPDAILLIQYDPGVTKQMKSLDRNFWPLLKLRRFRRMSVCLLVENFYSQDYIGNEVDGKIETRTSIQIDTPHNESAFNRQLESGLNDVVNRKAKDSYLYFAGRPCLVLWNVTGYKGDFPRVLRDAKKRYPFFVFGGENLHHRPDPADPFVEDHRDRIREYDGLYFYTQYNGGESYLSMLMGGIQALRLWWDLLQELFLDPTTGLVMAPPIIGPMTFAFDDSRLRGDKNSRVIPKDPSDNHLLLHMLKNLWCEGVIDGVSVVNDEPYEAAGFVRNVGHVAEWLLGDKALRMFLNQFVRHDCPVP